MLSSLICEIPSGCDFRMLSQGRRVFSSLGRIAELAKAAEKDPSREFLLLRELNRLSSEGPRKVIERVEMRRGYRPIDENSFREYIKAIVATGKVDDPSLNLSHLISPVAWPHGGPSVSSTPPVPALEATTNSVWKTLSGVPIAVVKFLTLSFILVAGWSIVMESASGNLAQKMSGQQAKTFEPVEATNVTMNDVKGCDEVKDELREIIQYLKDPSKFTRLGARLPKGMLLSGSPGTGKTLLARAIAGEAGVAFFQASGSDFEVMLALALSEFGTCLLLHVKRLLALSLLTKLTPLRASATLAINPQCE